MKETLKLGFILLIITAVSAGVLAAVQNVTGPIVAEMDRQASFGALVEIFSEADDFLPIEESKFEEIKDSNSMVREIFEAKKSDEVIGYAIQTAAGGYGGDIVGITGINSDGTLAGIKIVSNSETPNIGTRILEEDFLNSFKDKSAAGDLKAVGAPSADDEVLLLSGATVSVYAVLAGVNQANLVYNNYFSADGPVEVVVETEEEIKARFLSEIFSDAEFEEIDSAKLDEIKADNIFIREIYEAKVNGELVGYGIKTNSGGYGGDLAIITGINLDGTIAGIRIFDNDETPGIGTKIMESDFMDSFIGKNSVDDVELISGSTVSAEGVVYGVEGAIEAFNNFLVE